MPYINRKEGKVTGVFARPQHKGQEQLAEDSPEVREYQRKAMPESRMESPLTQKEIKAIRALLKQNGGSHAEG